MSIKKTCRTCHKEKNITAFRSVKTWTEHQCRHCYYLKSKAYLQLNRKEYNEICRERARQKKQKILDYLGGKCYDCGLVDHSSVYDVHHLDPTTKDKRFAVMKKKKWETLVQEFAKGVVLLCSNCHRKRHHEDTNH